MIRKSTIKNYNLNQIIKFGFSNSIIFHLNPSLFPLRGFVFTHFSFLHSFIIFNNIKSFNPSFSSSISFPLLFSPFLSLNGFFFQSSGNILNDLRKAHSFSSFGLFNNSILLNHNTILFNRRAIIGYKFKLAFKVK